MLYELKGSNVVCPYENVFLAQSLSHTICHPFQILKSINKSIPSVPNIKSIKKGRPFGMRWFNLKGCIQNKIGFSYLGGLGVGLI